MTTERAHEPDDMHHHADLDAHIAERTRIDPDFPRLLVQARERAHREGRYRLGPEDVEEFIALGPEGQHRLIETPGALDEWLAAHAAKNA